MVTDSSGKEVHTQIFFTWMTLDNAIQAIPIKELPNDHPLFIARAKCETFLRADCRGEVDFYDYLDTIWYALDALEGHHAT